ECQLLVGRKPAVAAASAPSTRHDREAGHGAYGKSLKDPKRGWSHIASPCEASNHSPPPSSRLPLRGKTGARARRRGVAAARRLLLHLTLSIGEPRLSTLIGCEGRKGARR